MVPLVGRSRPTSIRAMVVLPDPDSPTMPSEPPAGTVKSTSATAVWRVWPPLPSGTLKTLPRP